MSGVTERLRGALSSRYRIERELGRGGMATVFLAEDLRHRRPVAIKVLDPEVGAAIGPRRFLHEIETVARLTHPHVLPLHDSGEAGGLLFYVMPYVEGESLRQRLVREKQLPVEDALRIAREVADALGYAHGRGVVHRDVKPENILLESGHAVVADFGVARAVSAAGTEALTATGITVGTPAYMSPEQSAGSRDVDGRSDLYSLGCVLYEMLAGVPPFAGATAESLAHQHLNIAPRPVTELRPAVPGSIAAALQRALSKTPADRFVTMAEFTRALGRTPEAELGLPRREKAARPPLTLALGALALVAALVAAAAWQRWGPFAERSGSTSSAKRDWILVAAFQGPGDDPSIARTAREIVSAALDRSLVLSTVPADQIALALEQAGKPDTLALLPRVAREIAYRSGVRIVLEGEVGRLGSRFSVTMRVVEAEGGRQLLSLSDEASSPNALIPVLSRMAGRVRGALGENPWAISLARREQYAAATPSFEAYRHWAEGMRLYGEADFNGALRSWREAVIIDPDFATAWGSLHDAYWSLGMPDSAADADMEALRHPDRLDPGDDLMIEGELATWRGELGKALELYQRLTRLHPGTLGDAIAENRMEVILGAQGRLPEALAANTERIRKAQPIGAPQGAYYIRVGWLIVLGRLDDARAEANRLGGVFRQQAELNLALAGREWARAESLATALERDPRTGTSVRVAAATARASVAAVRGEVDAAQSHFRRAEELEHEAGRPIWALRAARPRVTLALASGRPVPASEAWLARDTTTTALITRAYMAAAARDTGRARQLMRELRARGTARAGAHGSTLEFIEASIAAAAGRWGDVVTLIAAPAREGSDRGHPAIDRIGVAPERWLVAHAYERLGQPDSAASFYEQLLLSDAQAPSLESFARLRLAMLYAGMGRYEAAKGHLAVLERQLTRPDPDARRRLEEVRSALRVSRDMKQPERPGI